MPEVEPFQIRASDAELEDLRRRLGATRWPDAQTVSDWSQGVPLGYLKEVVAYWRDAYDWRERERQLNRHAQFRLPIDGLKIHFIHVRSAESGALPLLITHGWPGSIAEFQKVIAPLTDPVAHGGAASDAFHVVAPSLPGYGFSDKPTSTGWGAEKIADCWVQLMAALGYERFVAQGGDWGSVVTTHIGIRHPGACRAIHLNMPIVIPDPATMNELTDAETAALAAMREHQRVGTGYSKQQSTRPQTLAYGLADSPAGQAGWILEKFHAWTDCDGHPENVLSRDELLDNVMLYWLPNTAASSARLYWESFHKPPFEKVRVPVGCSMFPKEIFPSSHRWALKQYDELIYWNELPRGGHFAAMETPSVFVDEVRSCFRKMRA